MHTSTPLPGPDALVGEKGSGNLEDLHSMLEILVGAEALLPFLPRYSVLVARQTGTLSKIVAMESG